MVFLEGNGIRKAVISDLPRTRQIETKSEWAFPIQKMKRKFPPKMRPYYIRFLRNNRGDGDAHESNVCDCALQRR